MGSDCAGCEGIVKVVQNILGSEKVDHAFSCDCDASVKRFILQNHDPAVWFDDLTKRVETPEVECYTAGFPCQPFSSAGKKKGLKDKRGKVVFHVARTIKHKKPPIVVLENVQGFMSTRFVAIREWLLEFLRKCGYEVHIRILNSKECGIPQNRPRCYIVALLEKKIKKPFRWPKKLKAKKLKAFLDKNVADDPTALPSLPAEQKKCKKLYAQIKAKGGDPATEEWICDTKAGIKFIKCMKAICPCITRSRGATSYWYSKGGRYLSLSELCRLQGLRDVQDIAMTGISRTISANNLCCDLQPSLTKHIFNFGRITICA